MPATETPAEAPVVDDAPSPPKTMLIEANPYETRIAVLEGDQRLTELFIERHGQRGLVGNIYRGRVNRVLPGMQAAFVDIGLERDAFLYVTEALPPHLARRMRPEPEEPPVDAVDEDVDRAEPEEVHDEDAGATSDEPPAEEPLPTIGDLLRPGQEIVVQVLKDALPNKGARISTQITLPGRYLVLLPRVPQIGVSRRIEDETERKRLRGLLEDLRPDDHGLIVRTAGIGATVDSLTGDLRYLLKQWERIGENSQRLGAPALLHRDLDLALRVVRDNLGDDHRALWVESDDDTHGRLVEFVQTTAPRLLPRLKRNDDPRLLFDRFQVEAQIEAALRSRVWLKSGGSIVINQTEALVAIDVNTSRYVGRSNLEDTVLTTNLEAASEIVRQIRLRNLGGIIVIDFIDMTDELHRTQVFEALEAELARDRAKNRLLSISEFGLVELTRKRSRRSLERVLTEPCPMCRGTGRVRSSLTVALELRRALLRRRGEIQRDQGPLIVRVSAELAHTLQREQRALLQELEQRLGVDLLLHTDDQLHPERFELVEP